MLWDMEAEGIIVVGAWRLDQGPPHVRVTLRLPPFEFPMQCLSGCPLPCGPWCPLSPIPCALGPVIVLPWCL